MKINKFWVDNFRTFKGHYEIAIDGDSSLNLVTAENNGAGKTSLFFAFYFLVIDYVNGKAKEDYINWDSDEMSCGINFDYENKNFDIKASLKRGKSVEKSLKIDNEEFSGATAVNKKLKEYFDPSLFLNATAIFQGSKNFTSVKDTERRDNLKKVFNIDYKDDIKNLDIEQKELEDVKIKALEKDITILQSKTFEEDKIKPFVDIDDDTIEGKKLEQKSLNDRIVDLKVQLSSFEKDEKEKNSLELVLANNEKLLTTENNNLKTVVDIIENLQNKKVDKHTIETYSKEIETIKIARFKEFDTEALIQIRDNLSANKSKLSSLLQDKKDCENGVCPVCGKEFTASDIKSINDEISSIQSTIALQEQERNALVEEERIYNKKVEDNRKNIERKNILQEKILSEEKRLAREEEIDKQKLVDKKEEKIRIEKSITCIQKSISETKEKLLSITVKDLSTIKSEIYDLSISISSIEKSIKEYESIKIENSVIIENNKKLKKEKEETEKAIIDKNKDLDIVLAKKDQLIKMKAFLKKEFPSYVIASMVEHIQDSMNNFISKVYYKDLNVQIDATDDNISVVYGSGLKKVDTVNASGAEESLLALSYCDALNDLKKYNILFIDEVDQAFTEDNSQKLAEIVVASQDVYDTIFAISHVKSTKDYYAMKGSNVINVDERIQ